jgi:hypothetical protein
MTACSKIALAAAYLVTCFAQIIKDCENSGNGFGQRDESDENFGHYNRSATDGDERVSFVKTAIGQRLHHLYFWHLADLMGVLKNVLNVLSPEVAADSDTVPRETTSTQRARVNRRNSVNVDEDKDERRAKKKFREALELSLKDIGEGLKGGNKVRAISALRVAIRAEEQQMMSLKFKCLTCTADEKAICEELMAHHGNRLAEYEIEMADLKV